jgi:hypothetical protein
MRLHRWGIFMVSSFRDTCFTWVGPAWLTQLPTFRARADPAIASATGGLQQRGSRRKTRP